jgi:hypothetical protein
VSYHVTGLLRLECFVNEEQPRAGAFGNQGLRRGRRRALSPDKAQELRNRVGDGEQKPELASEFGISRESLYHSASSQEPRRTRRPRPLLVVSVSGFFFSISTKVIDFHFEGSPADDTGAAGHGCTGAVGTTA